jgi:hypothetical protein
MGSLALLQSLKENVLGQANVKAIYGEPISAAHAVREFCRGYRAVDC